MEIWCSEYRHSAVYSSLCSWQSSATIEHFDNCKKTVVVEHEDFLKYLLIPFLQVKQKTVSPEKPLPLFTLSKEITFEKKKGMIFELIMFPLLVSKLSWLKASGVIYFLNRIEKNMKLLNYSTTGHSTSSNPLQETVKFGVASFIHEKNAQPFTNVHEKNISSGFNSIYYPKLRKEIETKYNLQKPNPLQTVKWKEHHFLFSRTFSQLFCTRKSESVTTGRLQKFKNTDKRKCLHVIPLSFEYHIRPLNE